MTLFDILHPQWGEIVFAAIILKPGMNTSSGEIILFIKNKIAKSKIVKVIDFFTDLPLTLKGKFIKYELKNDLINYRG